MKTFEVGEKVLTVSWGDIVEATIRARYRNHYLVSLPKEERKHHGGSTIDMRHARTLFAPGSPELEELQRLKAEDDQLDEQQDKIQDRRKDICDQARKLVGRDGMYL